MKRAWSCQVRRRRGDEKRRRAGWFVAAMMDLIRVFVFEVVACCTIVMWSCPPLIHGVSAESPPAGGGLCWPNPCQNRALCRLRGDGYSCFCVPGFQGVHCHIDVNECASQPCLNGATCADRPGSYLCLCPPAFAGVTCEVQIDECQSQPCLNGGSCHDDGGGFTCTCSPGFQGRRCETNTDECQEGPCQNGAVCIDGVNEYRCDCSHTAFTGPRCETPLPPPPPPPPCASQPCFNGAICQDTRGNYTCHCWPGFEGRRCELDISECSSGPCVHGGRCLERSWGHLYGSEPLLPGLYDPHRAAGYVCSCPPGTTGSHCQEVTNQCDPNPCRNGGRCESRAGGWVCHCAEPAPGAAAYGGPRCNVTLVGCQGHECQNHRSCSPFLLDGVHGYTCSCRPGFTGPLCKSPTTFSFERSGYLLLQSPPLEAEVACDVTLSFKTVMPEALLFRRRSRGLLLTLELRAGRLRLSLARESPGAADDGAAPHLLELPANVTDGEWHSVEARLGDWLLSLKLLDQGGSCESQSCRRQATAAVPRGVAGPLPTPQTTLVGGVQRDGGGAAAAPPAFVGCMRDVFVDFQLMVPEEWLSRSAVNVSPGCSHRDRCLESPCQNGGECVNLWQSYRCRCPRPYEGQDCEEEHVTARFGSDDAPSHAVFAVTHDLGGDLSVSLFLRTRRRRGLLLALANSSGDYLRLWLEEGRVRAGLVGRPGLGAPAATAVSDGEVHFVSVEVAAGRMALYVAAQKQGEAEVGAVEVRAGDAVYVGGLAGSAETAALGGYFKGCIQDLRLNERRLQFFGLDASPPTFPLRRMESVTAGCSGDPTCGSNPCLNGGMCYSIWDDFTCKCPPSTAGRRCEEVRWCELSPCPPEAECRMLNQGYECHANATFLDNSTVLLYRGNGNISRSLTSLSLRLRTRKRNAAILHAEQGAAFVTVSVQDGFLFMELQSSTAAAGEEEDEDGDRDEDGDGDGEAGGGGLSTVSLSSARSVSDGEWHSVQLFMATPWAAASHWTLVLDEEVDEASTSRSQGGNLDFLREGVDIYLGGLAPEAGWALTGCLGTVELGGLALSYLDASRVNLPRLQPERFLLAAAAADTHPLLGCSGAPVCQPEPCLNGGLCQDLFNAFSCSCADGWSGRRCDFLTDTCASSPCVHGNCSVHGRTYECACDFGYAGADCEEEVDVCQNHLCAHGATCLHGPDRYACLCAENYTGPLCNDRVEEIPWYIVVKRVRPKLPVSVCGDDTRNYTCFNGGNCTDRELSCDCPPGFAGHRCEQDVDECRSNPCLNGGYCRNHINRFSCVCDMSFAGEVCQTDVSDLYFYVAVLLWQNLFQLLSYLILRLDDEPEIDWGENL